MTSPHIIRLYHSLLTDREYGIVGADNEDEDVA
jgi:hypothetical protein